MHVASSEKAIDRTGRALLNEASQCQVASSAYNQPPTGPQVSVRNGVLKKRSRLLIRHHSGEQFSRLLIGGDGVDVDGFPLEVGESIELPVSPNVLVFTILSTGFTQDSNVRTLEVG